jgi:hypothetical protein
LKRMNDVYAVRMPRKLGYLATMCRLQAALGKAILGSDVEDWRWTDLENTSKPKARKTHPKSSLTDYRPIGTSLAGTRKGRPVSEEAKHRGVAKVLEIESVLVAKTVRITVPSSVTQVGFGGGAPESKYDWIYCLRNPHKKVTDKLLAHIKKESETWRMNRRLPPSTTPSG